MQQPKRWWWVAVACTVIFILFTIMVTALDGQTVDGHRLGLATMNGWWRDLVGVNAAWRVVSDVVAVGTVFGAVGLLIVQIVAVVRGRGLRPVVRDWWGVDLVLISLGICYGLFQIVVINYRPLLMHGVAEASYPSSHVLLFATVWPLLILTLWRMTKRRWVRVTVMVVGMMVMLAGIVARALSGYHWLSDLVGGVLLGVTLVAWYLALQYNLPKPVQAD